MATGLIDPVNLLRIQHLIVDEFQDLNPCDLEFVDRIAASDVTLFVAGDDDQSIYSFRFASPPGIQSFTARYPGAGDHKLGDCFRCMVDVLKAAEALIAAYPDPRRIPKK
jgi:DNA helicase-2/ATP-dependent DNA helicase PcrA